MAMFCDTQELDKLCHVKGVFNFPIIKKCAWRESNPRQTRFRKPPLYPTELQAQICLFNFILVETAPLGNLLVLQE